MENFVRIADTLINVARLIVVKRNPPEHYRAGWYLAVFDTDQNLLMTPDEGKVLSEMCQSLKPPSGNTAITSDLAK